MTLSVITEKIREFAALEKSWCHGHGKGGPMEKPAIYMALCIVAALDHAGIVNVEAQPGSMAGQGMILITAYSGPKEDAARHFREFLVWSDGYLEVYAADSHDMDSWLPHEYLIEDALNLARQWGISHDQ